jgi:hypothetical protein
MNKTHQTKIKHNYTSCSNIKKDSFEIGHHQYFGPRPTEMKNLKKTGSLRQTLSNIDFSKFDKLQNVSTSIESKKPKLNIIKSDLEQLLMGKEASQEFLLYNQK